MNDSSIKLLEKYKNHLSGLPPFDDKLFKDVTDEIKLLGDQIRQDALLKNQEMYYTCLVKHQCVDRDRRVLLAYSRQRLMDIKKYRWIYGPILPQEIQACMTESEKVWLKNYNKSLGTLMAVSCYGLDLSERTQPPKNLKVEVKCLEDYGELETVDGIIHLFKGSTHFLMLSDCENLINQGVLQRIFR